MTIDRTKALESARRIEDPDNKQTKRTLHCWHDGPTIWEWLKANPFPADIEDYVGSTCMLERDHAGPHEYTPDDCIGVSFAPSPKAKP